MSVPTDRILLDSLDGFAFQELCALIYKRLGYQVEELRRYADEGKDLILRGVEGLIVVECKHHPNKTIGRPTIQKLHSAMITEGAKGGIVITTGRFSKQAARFAQQVGIVLVDLQKLTLLAQQVGIKLVWGHTELHHDIRVTGGSFQQVYQRILRALSKRIQSDPVPISKFVVFEPVKLILCPLFVIAFEIRQDFYTQAGLIHQLDERGDLILTPSGNPLKKDYKLVHNRSLQELQTELQSLGLAKDVPHFNFGLDYNSLLEHAKRIICSMHSRIVSYVGRNNVYYEKECIPSLSSIILQDVKLIYVPLWECAIDILGTRRIIRILDTDPDKSFALNSGWPAGLCNDCWRLTYIVRICSSCSKTLCNACAYIKYINQGSEKVVLCGECGLREAEAGKAVFRIAA